MAFEANLDALNTTQNQSEQSVWIFWIKSQSVERDEWQLLESGSMPADIQKQFEKIKQDILPEDFYEKITEILLYQVKIRYGKNKKMKKNFEKEN